MLGGVMKRLFGGGEGGGAKEGETVDYNGYQITPAPRPQSGQYLTAGVIRKAVGEEVKEHSFVRADTHGSLDQAMSFSLQKAQQIIDQQGDSIFDPPR